MSAPHTPFPIADFKSGMFAGKEPWLSPQNAFRTLTNGRIYRGRLMKRTGYGYISDLGTLHAPLPGVGDGPNWTANYGAFVLDADGFLGGIIPQSAVFSWQDGGGATLQAKLKIANYPVEWDGVSSSVGLDVVDAATGSTVIGFYLPAIQSFAVTWSLHPSYTSDGPNRGSVSYHQPAGNAVTGLGAFKDSTGVEYALACDRGAVYIFDPADDTFKKNLDAYTLSGSDEDYFWFWPFDSFAVITNGLDPVLKYTPTGSPKIAPLVAEFDSTSPGNDLDSALIVMRVAGRAVFFNTTENGTKYPRRARWTVGGGAFETHDTDGQDFADAPADLGDIVTADLIGERVFVGFENGWMELVDTGFPDDPFRWRPTISRFGATAKLATIRDRDRLLHRSLTGMYALVGDGQYPVDTDIPDLIRDVNQSKRALSSGARNELERAYVWTFADVAQDAPTKMLVGQYDSGDQLSWSIYEIQMNVFGQFSGDRDINWDDLGDTLVDDLTGIADALGGSIGSVRLIGGANDGRVYTFDGRPTDLNDAITFVAISEHLAPFPGQVSHMGWIDIYATASENVTLTISLLGDDDLSVHKAVTQSLAPTKTTEKIYRRIPMNRRAAFHRIRIDATSKSEFAIDAIIPWFRPAGRLRAFG